MCNFFFYLQKAFTSAAHITSHRDNAYTYILVHFGQLVHRNVIRDMSSYFIHTNRVAWWVVVVSSPAKCNQTRIVGYYIYTIQCICHTNCAKSVDSIELYSIALVV